MAIIIGQLLQWIYLVCLCLGLLFNSLLIWLVLHKSPKEMREYKRILLQICFTDLALLISTAILEPFCFVYNGMNVCLFVSPLPIGTLASSPTYPTIIYTCWLTLYYFSANGFTVQFLYRYLVLNRHMRVPFAHYCLMLLLWALFCLPTSLWIMINAIAGNQPLAQNTRDELAQVMMGEANGTLQLINAIQVNNNHDGGGGTAVLPFLCWFFIFNTISYGTIAVCGYKMVKFVQQNSMPERERKMNRQLTRSLLALALFSLLVTVFNLMGSVMNTLLQSSLLFAALRSVVAAGWLTVVNPILTICTIRPFRTALFGILFGKKTSTAPNTVILF